MRFAASLALIFAGVAIAGVGEAVILATRAPWWHSFAAAAAGAFVALIGVLLLDSGAR